MLAAHLRCLPLLPSSSFFFIEQSNSYKTDLQFCICSQPPPSTALSNPLPSSTEQQTDRSPCSHHHRFGSSSSLPSSPSQQQLLLHRTERRSTEQSSIVNM
ncbi:hypothetical protein SLEP1_g59001 [Rubroshorea leprosula]|uniref:Uncharacterized protein n=1 Tax=Rubroshorea leprosula TaxID=152421 RepID=A0AAV5MV65_9ROSI|nr:hypothetical protein SLEP1_g59001 [Rubroshorea leprosula]